MMAGSNATLRQMLTIPYVVLMLLVAALIPAAPATATPWKDCAFNGRAMACSDSHRPDGSVRIVWQDGVITRLQLLQAGFPESRLRDPLGGVWTRRVLIQGNAVFTNVANGNEIVVPLRPLPAQQH